MRAVVCDRYGPPEVLRVEDDGARRGQVQHVGWLCRGALLLVRPMSFMPPASLFVKLQFRRRRTPCPSR
jgi:hypothetical protein